MIVTELQELKNYWNKKYPTVATTLWNNQARDKYFGLMSSAQHQVDLCADTIGELISQGEAFLRKVN